MNDLDKFRDSEFRELLGCLHSAICSRVNPLEGTVIFLYTRAHYGSAQCVHVLPQEWLGSAGSHHLFYTCKSWHVTCTSWHPD